MRTEPTGSPDADLTEMEDQFSESKSDPSPRTCTCCREAHDQASQSAAGLRAALDGPLAEEIAQSMWGYFQGGSAGSADACAYFANNKSTGGCKHVIERVQGCIDRALSPAGGGEEGAK